MFAFGPPAVVGHRLPGSGISLHQGVRRLTRVQMANDSRHLRLTDEAIFDYPWLFAQQVGHRYPSDQECARLGEYLLRAASW